MLYLPFEEKDVRLPRGDQMHFILFSVDNLKVLWYNSAVKVNLSTIFQLVGTAPSIDEINGNIVIHSYDSSVALTRPSV